ncbi:30S ribosomal protein S21 [Candidatus Microgenomates bacterium]|nr:30S ribosomal protein S21 [Candidatus Microgenomates bacterium]
MTELRRKEGESFESLMRRFNRMIQQEGVLNQARENISRQKKASKIKRRESAIRKKERKENKIKKFLF